MPLTSGSKLGPYEIVAPLGAGGMGEVYRARDPRLGREVAIKILHEDAAADASRRARFELEARAVAALNHPNILGVYDFASDDGRYYIVSELVIGESLRARIDRGPIGIRELYRIAVQFADGLSAAHAAGITHRDLKPENAMLTTDGRVKILDFGLARQAVSAASAEGVTRTQVNTVPGTVMGTVAYMSPEQVRGIATDHRSDQFSFGTILYELAGGGRPFVRETSAQTMTAVLTEEAPALDPKTPAPLRWTIARCHEKDAGGRYESTRDLYHDLRNQQDHLSDVLTSTDISGAPVAALPLRRGRLIAGLMTATLVVGLLVGRWTKPGGAVPGQLRFTPMEVALANPSDATWSPDGKAFAYDASVSGHYQVFLRYLNAAAPVQLTHVPSYAYAFGWTPDSKRVIVYGSAEGKATFYSVPAIGGEPELLATETHIAAYPAMAPDGKGFALLLHDGGKYFMETAASVGSPLKRYQPAPFETDTLFAGANMAISPNHQRLLYLVDTTGQRLAWDLPLPGGGKAPRRVLPGLSKFGGPPQFSWLPDSRHIVVTEQGKPGDEHTHLWIADVDSGRRRQLTDGLSLERGPVVSPDGSKVLFSKDQRQYSLVSVALDTAAADRIVTSELPVSMPGWAMHEEKFVYQSNRNGLPEIWLHADGWDRPIVGVGQFSAGTTSEFMNPALSPGRDRVAYHRIDSAGADADWISSLSGGSPVRLTNESNVSEESGCWSPDGKSFAYLRYAKGKIDLELVRTSGDATPETIRTAINSRLPEWSPDGKWISVMENRHAVLVSPEGKTVRDMGTLGGAVQVTFSKDSRLLYGIRHKDERPQLFSVEIESGKEKVMGEFDKDLYPSSYQNPGIRLSLSPDGKSILFPSYKITRSLWMLEGFDAPSWTERLREMLPW